MNGLVIFDYGDHVCIFDRSEIREVKIHGGVIRVRSNLDSTREIDPNPDDVSELHEQVGHTQMMFEDLTGPDPMWVYTPNTEPRSVVANVRWKWEGSEWSRSLAPSGAL